MTTTLSPDATRDGPAPSIGVKLGYGVGNLGKSIVWTSFESFMLFYLVAIAGFSPLAAGAVLTLAMLWDAMVDVAIAGWTDRHGRADALGRLVLFGAPLGGTGFWLAFTLERPAVIALAIVLCRIGYSMCDIGHNTLLVRVARTPRDATAVSGIRLIFSASGAGLVALASGWSLSVAGRAGQQGSFATGAMIGGMVYVATLFVAVAATRRLPPVRHAAAAGRTPLDLRALLAHAPFRRTLTLVAVQAGMVPLFVRALPFFGQAVHGDPGWAGPALATITLAQSLSLPGWIAVSRRYPPLRLATIGHGVLLVAMAGLAIRSDGVAGTALLLMTGVALSGMNMAIWALLALAVRGSIAGGSAAEALPVGIFLGVVKGASALGTAAVALLVAFGGTHGDIAVLPACAVGMPLTGCAAALLLLRRWPR